MIAGVLKPMKLVATSAASWARFSAITGGGTTPGPGGLERRGRRGRRRRRGLALLAVAIIHTT